MAWQPILGGGLRGLGYGAADAFPLPDVLDLLERVCARREAEWKLYWDCQAKQLGSLFRP